MGGQCSTFGKLGTGEYEEKKHLFAWYRLLWVGTLETQGQNEGSL